MKIILFFTFILFLFSGCKNNNSPKSGVQNKNISSTEVEVSNSEKKKVNEESTELEDENAIVEQIERIEEKKQIAQEAEKVKAIKGGKTCETILKDISDAITRLNNNGDNDKDLEFLNRISDDVLYIDCSEDMNFQNKVNKLYDSWN